MKHLFLAIAATVGLSACAGSKVTNTNFTSGATAPKKIFIRPFETAEFTGSHGGDAMRAIHESQGGTVFANILKDELEKIAPTTVLKRGERPDGGWLVSGDLEVVNAGNPWLRKYFGHFGAGRSGLLVHVKVTDADGSGEWDSKGASGNTLYDFDVTGGSRLTGPAGGVMAPGLGYAPPFDFRNAAGRIGQVLDPDRERYGYRAGSSIR